MNENFLKSHFITNTKLFLKDYGIIILIFILAPYFVLTPLLKYESWCGGHDSNGTVFNAWSMVKILREEFHVPVSWQMENCGYKGNPYWLFYQPFSYVMIYFMSIITSLFDNNYLFSAMKLATYVSFLISEIGMFFLLRSIFKNSSFKILFSTYGAIIYLLAPYRFIDLYSRNAYSELWVFPWMPFYLWGFYKLFFLKELNGWILITLSMPLLFLSHLMPSFFFVLTVNLAFLFFLVIKRRLKSFFKEDRKTFFWWFIGNVAGLSLSCVYVLPAMNTIKYLNGDIMGFDRVSLDHVLNHISWCFDMLDPFNFKGAWQVGQLFLASILVLNFLLFSKKDSAFKDLMVFLNICAILTFIFLMSRTFWELAPKALYTLQFSWRLFVVYSVIGSVIVALVVHELNLKIPVLIVLLAFHFYTGQRFLYYGSDDVIGKHFDSESWVNELYDKHFTTTNNYSPRSILPKTSDPILFNFEHADKLGLQEKFSNTFLLNLKPGTQLLSHKRYGSTFEYEMFLDNSAFLIFKQYFYPTWKLYIDKKRVKDLYFTEFGFIGFEVPKGRHLVKIRSN